MTDDSIEFRLRSLEQATQRTACGVVDIKAEAIQIRRLMEERHAAVLEEFGHVRSRIDTLEVKVADGFEAVDGRFDRVEGVLGEHSVVLREILKSLRPEQ